MSFEILTNKQMSAADGLATAAGLAESALIEAAGRAVASIVAVHYTRRPVVVICGPGNNGADGRVAAAALRVCGFQVEEFNLQTLASINVSHETLVIDALFGTGFSRELSPEIAAAFAKIRAAGCPVIAVDIPSGVNGDTGFADPATLQAERTVTFFRKKLGHMLMPGHSLCGQITVHDIGIKEAVLKKTGFAAFENNQDIWRSGIPRIETTGHKYGRGHILMFGGARMTGAIRLASEAAMRAGAGLCTIVSPPESALVYRREAAPHIMIEERLPDITTHLADKRRNVFLIGPGAGLHDAAGLRSEVLVLLQSGQPIVLDADALTCFEGYETTLYDALHKNCVITPHEGEFKKIFPDLSGSKLEKAEKAAAICHACILLKGPDTVIAAPGRKTVINIHATPWLATAGSGDVLAGIVGGLMAQGMDTFDAACAAAWIHGEAGIQAGPRLIAPDIIEQIPLVIKKFA